MRLRVLTASLLAPLLAWGALPLLSHGASQGDLHSIRGQIGATRARIEARRGHERVLTSDISAYTHRIAALQERIGGLQQRESSLQSSLERQRARLDRTQANLRAERARLVRLRARLVVARTALSRRLVDLYEADVPDLVTVILNSNGFADLIERGDFLRRISDADRQIVSTVAAAKRDATASAKRLAVLEQRQQAIAASILTQREQVTQVKQQLQTTQGGYAHARAGMQSTLGRVRSERHNLEGKLTALVAEENKVQAALAAAAQNVSRGGAGSLPAQPVRAGSGMMIWPVNGPITSPFCEARAWESCHPGIDIGVPSGTPVRAAAAGRVVLEQGEASSGGYGNFLCIQHTASISTCYAHLMSFSVGSGQSVAQGQVVAISDCTGRCYGPHLHFEVRINGAVTNPLSYL